MLTDRTTDSDLASAFKKELELLSEYAKAEGFELKPYASPEMNVFRALPTEMAGGILAGVRDYRETMTQIREQGESLRSNLNSVWLTLRKLGLRWDDELFKILEPDDLVEVHTLEGIQVFRSFHLFQFISYDLETLCCKPWYELFSRPEKINAAYIGRYEDILHGRLKGTEPVGIGEHLISEIGADRRVNLIRPRILSMLHDPKGTPRGYVHAAKVRMPS